MRGLRSKDQPARKLEEPRPNVNTAIVKQHKRQQLIRTNVNHNCCLCTTLLVALLVDRSNAFEYRIFD